LRSRAIGLGFAALERATRYAKERVVFGRPIGQNQGVAASAGQVRGPNFPRPSCSPTRPLRFTTKGSSAARKRTPRSISAPKPASPPARPAVLAHGGMGYAKEYDVERYMREAMIARIAPVSREMILNFISERVLGLPKSY
jgi:acyl-CoA dehydrogenase